MQNVFNKTGSWLIHSITISGAAFGLWALDAIHHGQFTIAIMLIMATVFIDSIDGPLARRFSIKQHIPDFDGALLDNIIDYFTWAVVPAFFLLCFPILPPATNTLCAAGILVASAYQFCCTDAKEDGLYFKRFPSLWSIVVPIMYNIHWPREMSLFLLSLLITCSFLPIYCAKPFTKARLCRNNKLNTTLQMINRLSCALGTIAVITSALISVKLLKLNPNYVSTLISCCTFLLLGIMAITTHYKHTAKPHND